MVTLRSRLRAPGKVSGQCPRGNQTFLPAEAGLISGKALAH
jgi:hypothetical protein